MNISSLCRKAAAEGSVLLKNDRNLLPLNKGTKVALFGRLQPTYYKGGTGSGGLVHLEKEPCLLESLRNNPDLMLDETLIQIYESWIAEHPFDDGGGVWAGEPWFQEEMPLCDEIVQSAADRNDVAVVVFGRTAGEDHDNADEKGSYRLTDTEEQVLEKVTTYFKNVIVALNVGNIIDLSCLERYPITSLLYIWQGGMEGANAFADLLSGKSAPSGKLSDTQAFHITDYPSNANFGDLNRNLYKEDIYVGYRYFETFAKDKVQFPFGFGLTYTTFAVDTQVHETDGYITVSASVTNTGDRAGREVVQVYFKAPCGKLGTPARQLVSFAKTKELAPLESDTLNMTFSAAQMAAYDDAGVTGHKSAYVLEQGEYEIFVGTDVREAKSVFTYFIPETIVVEQLEEVMAPVISFDRIHAVEEDDVRKISYCETPKCTVDLNQRIADRRPTEIPFTNDKGIKLRDVYEDKATLEEFVAQLTDDDLAALVCGEGMNSPKATPGTGGALGGQTESLSNYGIPVCCVTDGPSGIRLDDGKKASLLPNGTLLACSWDDALVEELYTCIGKELKVDCVDSLLGPGINIHRHPLCGRNFEYFSEDPYLAGKLAAAVTRGVAEYNCYATIKHFCANNQESSRYNSESVVSERALREIYLKPFEIAVKEGENVLVMTSYNPVNGYWAASHYDLTTTLLRNEWGFDNFVMTDWWAQCNLEQGSEGSGELLQAMVRAGNDVYMVCEDANVKAHSVLEGLESGYLTRGELQRCVMTICNWILRSNTFAEYLENGCKIKYPVVLNDAVMKEIASFEAPVVDTEYDVDLEAGKTAVLVFTGSCDDDNLSQNPITVYVDDTKLTFSVSGATFEIKRGVPIREADTHKISISHTNIVKVDTIIVKQ